MSAVSPAAAAAGEVVELSPDGAWCWFQDPRAVYHEGRRRRTYAGWVTRSGDIQVGSYDHGTREVSTSTLRAKWQRDDHASPALLVLPDGRLTAFYSKHNGRSMYARTTRRPEDVSEWAEEVLVSAQGRITYPNPARLSREGGRIWLLWRGRTWKPTFSVSQDGVRWAEPRVMIQAEGREARSIRPYLKAASDGRESIHLAFTDGHPRNEPRNCVYYARYARGAFFRADGARVGTVAELPLRHGRADLVYDARETGVRAWVWDVAFDGRGRPVVAYTRLPAETDHRCHYARWDGRRWEDHEVARAGGWFPETPEGAREREPHYSGGVALDHARPDVLWLSRPGTGQAGEGAFELERRLTTDGGATWSARRVTSGSREDNVRPVVPRGWRGPGDHVLWMRGRYVHYTGYSTRIMMLVP